MPTKPATRLDYGRRIARAMAHVADRPDRTPTLDELAAVAAFSPCHFHRIYRAVAGETPAETLARARLSRAAVELLRSGSPVAQVARRAGYGSAAAFTRAFRAAHGVPPAAYRARGGVGLPVPPGGATRKENGAVFHVDLRELPALRLAAVRHVGPYHGIGAAFDRLQAWGAARGLVRPGTRFFGLFHDDPGSVPADRLRADAGFAVGPEFAGEGEVGVIEVPAAPRVAVLRFRGPYAELERAYGWLYGEWLPASGEEPADRPGLEEYVNDPRATPPPELLTDIMLPLRERVPAPA
jgi:AraC family transcriptional regulator